MAWLVRVDTALLSMAVIRIINELSFGMVPIPRATF